MGHLCHTTHWHLTYYNNGAAALTIKTKVWFIIWISIQYVIWPIWDILSHERNVLHFNVMIRKKNKKVLKKRVTGNNNNNKNNLAACFGLFFSWQKSPSVLGICARALVHASTPRPELEESPLISTRTGEEPVSDVTAHPPTQFKFTFSMGPCLSVYACVCVPEILYTSREESRANTPHFTEEWPAEAPMWPEPLCPLKY